MTRNRLIARGAIISGTIVLAYVAGWFIVANILKSGIADWVIDRRTDGWTVRHGAITMGGFPFSWRASIEKPHLAQTKQDRNYHWSGPAIALNWKPWNPHTVQYATSGVHKFRLDPDTGTSLPETTLEMASGQGHLIFGPRGRLNQLAILLDDARLSLANAQSLRFNRFQAVIDNNPPANGVKPTQPHLKPSFRLNSDIFGLTLPEGQRLPLGRTIGRIALGGTIMGRIPPGRPSDTLSVWQKEGGTVEISRLDFGWGPLKVQATGTMALDSALQPVGALTGKVTGYGETLEALATAKLIKSGIALIGKFALGALARTPNSGGRPEIEVPVTLQKSWLYVGPIKLLQLPAFRWR